MAPTIQADLDYASATPSSIYDGPCRAQAWAGDTRPSVGDETFQRSAYLVVLERDAAGIEVGARVDIYESTDSDLVGLRLTVHQPIDGSLRWERDLFCVADRS